MNLSQQLRDTQRYLTTTEVMKLLKLRRNTVCDWVQTGLLPAIRMASGYRFDPFELADWLDTRHNVGTRRPNRAGVPKGLLDS